LENPPRDFLATAFHPKAFKSPTSVRARLGYTEIEQESDWGKTGFSPKTWHPLPECKLVAPNSFASKNCGEFGGMLLMVCKKPPETV
jgi:hypothetical protein